MAHVHQNKKKLLARIQRLQGQLNSVASALEGEEDCYRVLQILASARGAMQGLMGEVLEAHIRAHVIDSSKLKDSAYAGEEIIQIMKSYWR